MKVTAGVLWSSLRSTVSPLAGYRYSTTPSAAATRLKPRLARTSLLSAADAATIDDFFDILRLLVRLLLARHIADNPHQERLAGRCRCENRLVLETLLKLCG